VTTDGSGERFHRRPRARGPRSEPGLDVDPRDAFDAELDAISTRVARVEAAGRSAFQDGSPGYDTASMAIIRLAALFEVRRFEPFLDGISPIERNAIRATRHHASHQGYRQMDDDEFWHTITVDVPDCVERLRGRASSTREPQ